LALTNPIIVINIAMTQFSLHEGNAENGENEPDEKYDNQNIDNATNALEQGHHYDFHVHVVRHKPERAKGS
jgi:hypothetical protein